MVGLGAKPGVSDLIMLVARGRYHFLALELKREGARPSPAQRDFLEAVEIAGGCGRWADSFDRARAIVDSYAALTYSEELPPQ